MFECVHVGSCLCACVSVCARAFVRPCVCMCVSTHVLALARATENVQIIFAVLIIPIQRLRRESARHSASRATKVQASIHISAAHLPAEPKPFPLHFAGKECVKATRPSPLPPSPPPTTPTLFSSIILMTFSFSVSSYLPWSAGALGIPSGRWGLRKQSWSLCAGMGGGGGVGGGGGGDVGGGGGVLGSDAVAYLDFDSQLVSYYAFISVIYILSVAFWRL